MESRNETQKPAHRLVMLGASNLSRAFPIAVSMSQQVFDRPLAIYVAKGHGRSYGQDSHCFGKKNSGIFSCGIWRAIELEKNVPISAFITDIGNDLAYEVPVETVVEWVEACLDRLLAQGARVVLSDLPIEALRQVSATRYRLFRAVLFPQCRLDWRELLSRAELLSERLQALAKSRKVPIFAVRKTWYGLDPIHPRRRYHPEMWSRLLGLAAKTSSDLSQHRCPLGLAWYLRRLRPESWSTFSFSRRAHQPNGRLRDESTIALYWFWKKFKNCSASCLRKGTRARRSTLFPRLLEIFYQKMCCTITMNSYKYVEGN